MLQDGPPKDAFWRADGDAQLLHSCMHELGERLRPFFLAVPRRAFRTMAVHPILEMCQLGYQPFEPAL